MSDSESDDDDDVDDVILLLLLLCSEFSLSLWSFLSPLLLWISSSVSWLLLLVLLLFPCVRPDGSGGRDEILVRVAVLVVGLFVAVVLK